MDQIIGWHLELSRRCTLKCPACPRTYNFKFIENPNQDLSFDSIKSFFKKELLAKIKYLFFQGNLGDPIYHPNFHEISEYFFDVQHLSVITNGIQNRIFWSRVLETWPENSLITLSIDGLKDTNSIYRVGAPWKKIESLFDLISTVKRKCKVEWKFLVFDHNKHQIEEASELANKIGIDSFRIQQSRPLNDITNLDGFLKVVDLEKDHLSAKNKMNKVSKLIPFCKTLDLHYVNARGEYFPCCWWPGHYQENKKKNPDWHPLNISDISMNDALKKFQNFSKIFDKQGPTPEVCNLFCSRKLENRENLDIPSTQVYRQFLTGNKPTWD